MMRWTSRLLAAAALVALAGCEVYYADSGSWDPPPPPPQLFLEAEVRVVDRPGYSEGAGVAGTVTVMRGETSGEWFQSGAIVRVNGTLIPETYFADGSGGQFDLQNAAPWVQAGGQVTITAEHAGDVASITIQCPRRVTITSPADGAFVPRGGNVQLTWYGNAHQSYGDPDPRATLRGRTRSDVAWSAESSARVPSGSSSATLWMPSSPLYASYFAELYVPGPFVSSWNNASAGCYVVQRVAVTPY